LFLLYEVAGIVTNLAAGWLAARFGLAATLYGGLALQIGALVALSRLDPSWAVAVSVAFVMAVQGVSGVHKIVKLLLKAGADAYATLPDGHTPLDLAMARPNNEAVIDMLRAHIHSIAPNHSAEERTTMQSPTPLPPPQRLAVANVTPLNPAPTVPQPGPGPTHMGSQGRAVPTHAVAQRY
jgi:hypothetical protein